MKRVETTPRGMAASLRRLAQEAPRALAHGMVESAAILRGALVQREIAASDPQPVDQGQYKAGWTMAEVEGGAVVGNTSKQALWIERGRGPGPVPFGAILAWVRRKGFARAQGRRGSKNAQEQAEFTAALAIARKIEQQGIEPRWILRRAIDALRGKVPGILRRSLREVRP